MTTIGYKRKFMRSIVFTALASCFMLAAVMSNITEARASQIYSWGSYGETVKSIQTKLSRWGYYNGPLDGIFGIRTYESVLDFQKTNGLKQDGICGRETLGAMGILQTSKPEDQTYAVFAPTDSRSARETDIWLLACVINGEGRGESYIGQVAIGAVVMNRVKNTGFSNTISGVIFQPGAFDAVWDGQFYLTPSESCVNAARDAYNGWDPVDGALYYWNPSTATNQWVQTLTVAKTIGNHVFALD